MVALCTVWHNFVRMHRTLKNNASYGSGDFGPLYEMRDLVELMDANVPAPAKRGPYKKRVA